MVGRRRAGLVVSVWMAFVLLVAVFGVVLNVPVVWGSGTIYIQADGSIDPPTAPIQRDENFYTFTDNIYDSIVVQRNNIIIDGSGYTLQGFGSGNGFDLFGINNVTIKKVNIKGFYEGVYLYSSSNNNISENNITNNLDGVKVSSVASINNTISGNSITNNSYYGIQLEWLSNNTVSGNSITNNRNGVVLDCSSNNVLKNNSMTDNRYNFGVFGDWLSHFVQDVDVSNTVNGEPIYYLINQNNVIINSSTYPDIGYLAMINSYNVTIEGLELRNNRQGILLANITNSLITNNNVTNNGVGVYLLWSSNNNISGNKIIKNEEEGIYLNEAIPGNNTITKNKISNSEYGIKLSWYTNTTIAENTISDNQVGIDPGYGGNNKIYHNNFINNTESARSPLSTNSWDDGYPSGGNYWSDYEGIDVKSGSNQDQLGSDGIGDAPYIIDANNLDRFPLMKPRMPPNEHDLVVSLKALTILRLGDSTPINATVMNTGLSNETSVELFLVINGSIVNSTTVPFLEAGSTHTISHPWTSTIEGKYNVTAYSPQVPLETSIEDNQATIFIIVTTAKRVPYDYPSIEAAINAASSGDTLLVASGMYGSVVVNKAVTLIGEDRNTTITGYIKVTADNVVISGFTIKGIDLGRIEPTPREKSDNTVIRGNIITAEVGAGVAIYYSRGNILSENIITNNGGSGVYLYHSSDIRVSNNIITNNNNNGIGIDTCGNIAVVGNTIANNKRGIHHLPTSVGSRFYHNNFINNTEQVYLQVSIQNSWDDGYPSGGNYWSDYTGVDSDGDGIGDTPYILDANNQDRYPLMHPCDITVEGAPPPPPPTEGFPMWTIGAGAAVAAIAIAVAATLFLKKRKQQNSEKHHL